MSIIHSPTKPLHFALSTLVALSSCWDFCSSVVRHIRLHVTSHVPCSRLPAAATYIARISRRLLLAHHPSPHPSNVPPLSNPATLGLYNSLPTKQTTTSTTSTTTASLNVHVIPCAGSAEPTVIARLVGGGELVA